MYLRRPQAGLSALRIATVAGIPIRLHFTFLLFLLWVGLAGPHRAGGLSIAYVLALFLCVVLHELGHSVVAQRYGIPVLDITLYPIGGVARIEKRPTARQELAIAVAGPAVNVVIALLLIAVLAAMKAPPMPALLQSSVQTLPVFLAKVLLANIWLVLFNLIPAFPMDGGRGAASIAGAESAAGAGDCDCGQHRTADRNCRRHLGDLQRPVVFDVYRPVYLSRRGPGSIPLTSRQRLVRAFR